jgi:hypothetical protein
LRDISVGYTFAKTNIHVSDVNAHENDCQQDL